VYVIVRSGSKQYRTEIGHHIDVEKLPHQVGEQIELDQVLLVVDGERASVGQPLVEGALVKATVVEHFKGKKIIVFKYRPKVRYRRKQGHRQTYTRLHIDDIVPGGKRKAAKAAKAKPEDE
jgi:large subunit ribosomal protein L21